MNEARHYALDGEYRSCSVAFQPAFPDRHPAQARLQPLSLGPRLRPASRASGLDRTRSIHGRPTSSSPIVSGRTTPRPQWIAHPPAGTSAQEVIPDYAVSPSGPLSAGYSNRRRDTVLQSQDHGRSAGTTAIGCGLLHKQSLVQRSSLSSTLTVHYPGSSSASRSLRPYHLPARFPDRLLHPASGVVIGVKPWKLDTRRRVSRITVHTYNIASHQHRMRQSWIA